jgi:hypothetical protein
LRFIKKLTGAYAGFFQRFKNGLFCPIADRPAQRRKRAGRGFFVLGKKLKRALKRKPVFAVYCFVTDDKMKATEHIKLLTKQNFFAMRNRIFLFALLLTGVWIFQSCKKDDNATEALVTTSEDIATHEDFSEQIDLDADMAVEERGGGNTGCPTVTFAQPQGTWPNTITIDFGAGCEYPSGSGRMHKGKVIIQQSAALFTAGATRTLNFDGYFFNDIGVQGVKTWTNNGQDDTGVWSYTKTGADMVLNYPDGSSSSWNHTHTSRLIEGGNTPALLDNVWSITGSTNGLNRQGNAFSSVTLEPLIKKAICRWISAGTIELTRGDRSATLDFGDGACDRFGRLTLENGDTRIIRLRL